MKYWDIFCKIVDNFGDIGVCWRLAKQLHAEHDVNVRLWIDDLAVAKQLIPELNAQHSSQTINNIHIRHWHASSQFNQVADVVIEAFGCELPKSYLALMQPQTLWINLEYLSAEQWVADFHGKHSKRGALTRHFFFPGFTAGTGGLLRERDITGSNQAIAKSAKQQAFFQQRQLAPISASSFKVSLFCYPNAPIDNLLNAMSTGPQHIECFVPVTSIVPKVAAFFGRITLSEGEVCTYKNLSVKILPFLSQADYDKLLAACDINFVRGEDSWIRAIWAGKPFVWQPYWQTENTHLVKLKAFLETFYTNVDKHCQVANTALYLAWANTNLDTQIWQDYLQHLSTLQQWHTKQLAQLAALPDLASNLVIFIEKLRLNKI